MFAALIAIHAAAGLVALGAGWRVITRGAAVALYFWSLAACTAQSVPIDCDRRGDKCDGRRVRPYRPQVEPARSSSPSWHAATKEG
jgi:hypothetical protein